MARCKVSFWAIFSCFFGCSSFLFDKDSFGFNSDDHQDSFGVEKQISTSKSKDIHSPKVLWEKSNSHVYMTYVVNERPTNFNLKYRLQCRPAIQVLGNKVKFSYWKTVKGGLMYLNADGIGVERIACIELFDEDDEVVCSTFRLRIILKVENGDITLGIPKFRSSCDLTEVQTTADCNFDGTDCSFRNDACGIVSWRVGIPEEEDRRGKRANGLSTNSDYSLTLLKSQSTSTCHYDGISVTDLQPSGFTFADIDYDRKSAIGPNIQPRSTSDFALFLDPNEIGGSHVAIGIFNTPTVTYHSSNEVISFIYHFYSYGYHQLVVSLICVTDSSYVYLNREYSNYRVSNFQLNTYDLSGIKCLDLHSYLGECESFQVQFTGGVVGSKLAVDDVYFYTSDSFPCGKYDNI